MFVRIKLFFGLFSLALPGGGGEGITVKRPKLKRSVRIDMGIDILFMLCRPKAPYGVSGIRKGGGGERLMLALRVYSKGKRSFYGRGGLSAGLKWTR